MSKSVVRSAAVLLSVGFVLTASTYAAAAQPVLQLGSHGAAVQRLQQGLASMRFLRARGMQAGSFDMRTWHAVVAFQGWNGLARDGIVGPHTRRALAHPRRLTPWSTTRGYEVHVRAQVLLMIGQGKVQRAIHVSTGAGGTTPVGHFRVRRRETLSWSNKFHVWMPLAQYFYGGYAMHQFPSVPAYPASHGCIRVPAQEASSVWNFGRVGMRLWVGA